MISDYKLSKKHLLTTRQVWLISRRIEEDHGDIISKSMYRALETGEIRYDTKTKKIFKLCRSCVDYKNTDEFYDNSRYVMGIGYICKECVAMRRRIKKYGELNYVTDNGINKDMGNTTFNLEKSTIELINLKTMEDSKDGNV